MEVNCPGPRCSPPEGEKVKAKVEAHGLSGIREESTPAIEIFAEPEAGLVLEVKGPRKRTLWSDTWLRLRRDKAALLGGVMIILFALTGLLAPWLAPYDPIKIFPEGLTAIGMPVFNCREFWLGTDYLGRDMLSRLIWGSRVSLTVGVLANGLAVLVGVILGGLAGYLRGWVETVIMRLTDTFMCLPYLLFSMALIAILGRRLSVLILAIAILSWPWPTRIFYGEVLSIGEREFIVAARSVGVTDMGVLFRHVIPQLMSIILVYLTMGIATAIMTEAALSYLGLGVQPPMPSWGLMINAGQEYYRSYPWLMIYPGLAITLTVLSFSMFGDGLRDALNPQETR